MRNLLLRLHVKSPAPAALTSDEFNGPVSEFLLLNFRIGLEERWLAHSSREALADFRDVQSLHLPSQDDFGYQIGLNRHQPGLRFLKPADASPFFLVCPFRRFVQARPFVRSTLRLGLVFDEPQIALLEKGGARIEPDDETSVVPSVVNPHQMAIGFRGQAENA